MPPRPATRYRAAPEHLQIIDLDELDLDNEHRTAARATGGTMHRRYGIGKALSFK